MSFCLIVDAAQRHAANVCHAARRLPGGSKGREVTRLRALYGERSIFFSRVIRLYTKTARAMLQRGMPLMIGVSVMVGCVLRYRRRCARDDCEMN